MSSFICQFCKMPKLPQDIVPFYESPKKAETLCNHYYCERCFKIWINRTVHNKRLKKIICPIHGCNKELDHRWLMQMHEKHIKDSLMFSRLHNYILVMSQSNKYVHCCIYKCYGVFEISECDNISKCKVCKNYVCLKCERALAEEYYHLHYCYEKFPSIKV